MNRRLEFKETWTMDVKGDQIEGLRRSLGHRYHIHDRYDSRGDVSMHDFPPDRLIDSQGVICNIRTGEIIPMAEPYHLKMRSLCVVWHPEVRK